MPEIVIGTGTLLKRIYSEFIPGRPGSPGKAGKPAIPAHWETVSQQVCVLFSGDPIAAMALLSAKTGESLSFSDTYYVGTELCTTVDTSVFVPYQAATPPTPPVPATPDQMIYDYQLGWNARVRSLPTMHYDGNFSAVVLNNTIGGMIGLTVHEPDGGYADMTNAFYVRRGTVSIYEFGAEVQSIGSYPGAVLKIRRAADKVQYYVDNTKVREVDAAVMAPMWFSAALYSGGDRIISPAYTEEATARLGGVLGGFCGYITDTDYCTTGGRLQAFTGGIGITIQNQIIGSLQPMFGYLGKDACILGGALQAMTGSLNAAGLVPSYGIIGGVIHPMVGNINVLSGSVMTVDATLQNFVGLLSDVPMGYIEGSLPAFTGGLLAFEPGNAYLISDAEVSGDIVAAAELVAVINSSGTITGLMVVEVLHSALMASTSTIGLAMTTQAQIDALMQSVARSIIGMLPPDQTGEAWVLNADAGGMTRYSGYDFNSFAKIGESYYGAKADGIYILEGPDDNGTAIDSSVNFGNLGFGSIERKALPYIYAGVASDGVLRLKVVADGQTYYYVVRDNTQLLKAHRFELGRGLRASYYDLEIQSVGGTAFDLAEVEFYPVKLSRRL